MRLVDWGDGLDDRLLGRLGRPYESLRSGDREVEGWWADLSPAERRNFAIDLNKGTIPTDPISARAAVALLELRLRRYWVVYLGAAIPTVIFAVVFWLAGSFWWVALGALGLVPGLAIGRLRVERQLNMTRAIAELAARGRPGRTTRDET